MLFLAYGQQKSASTFLANLARQACHAAGADPDAVKKRLFTGKLEKKRSFWNGPLFAVSDIAGQMHQGEHTVVKTHSKYRLGYAKTLVHPDIRILISYRHPGDAALSAFEADKRARRENLPWPFFASLRTPREAIDAIATIVREDTTPWLKSGLGTAFNYGTLTRESEQVIGHLAEFLGVEKEQLLDYPGVAKLIEGKTKVYNFNKGIAGRHHDVFSAADLAYLPNRCGPFIRFYKDEIDLNDL